MINNRQFIRDSFYLKNNLLFFNFGTYGVCPKPVLEDKIKFLREFEENPVLGFLNCMFDEVTEITKALAERICVDYKYLALVNNVTHGVAAILQSIDVKEGDEILLTNFTYSTVRVSAENYFVKRGGTIRILNMEYPFHSKEHIISIYMDFVKKFPRINYAIIDHIASFLPMIQPVKELVQNFRELGIFVIVDGAHSPGQIKDFNVGSIDADIYLGNLHKWYFVPRPLGFIAIHPDCKLKIEDPVVSHFYDSSFSQRFIFPGTHDMTNMLSMKSAFKFIDTLGGMEAITTYNTALLDKGIAYLEDQWGVRSLQFPENAPFMRIIPLPPEFEKHRDTIIPMIAKSFEVPYYQLTIKKFGFIAAIGRIQDKLHFRLCCQVWSEYEHFVKFSEKVLEWLEMLDNEKIPK